MKRVLLLQYLSVDEFSFKELHLMMNCFFKFFAKLIFLMFLFYGCARVHTLALREKKFSVRPDNIVWIQAAGLSEEQLAILRFGHSTISEKTSFESSECLSKIWAYNLFKIRPTAHEGFLSQITGSGNIKNNCSDYQKKPIWNYLKKEGVKPIIFESGVSDKDSLVQAYQCQEEGVQFRENLTLFRMSSISNPDAHIFHHQDYSELQPPGIYYDKSCQRGVCYSTNLNNVSYLWERYSKVHPRVFFIIRDFKIYDALMREDIAGLREALIELEKIYGYFSREIHKKGPGLLLLTSSGSRRVELPQAGKEWAQFEKSGKNILFKNSSLLSIGFSLGASAENFCGFFDESDLLRRILWSPKKQRPFFFN